MQRKKKRRKIKISGIIIIIVLLVVVITGGYFINKKNLSNKEEKNKVAIEKDIKSHYNEKVITNKETVIYDKDGHEIGKIGNGVGLLLDDFEITKDTINFKLKDFEDSYVSYKDVDKIDKLDSYSDRYKKYIPFNINIKTNDKTSFYDEEDNLVYTFNKTFDLPVIIKDDDKYGVEYRDRLLYVKKDDVLEEVENKNTDKGNSNGVAVLNYHFFYDDSDPDSNCREEICASKTQFKTHLDYFKENDIFPIKMHELELYMDGKLRLPKSVLITIDDGGRTDVGIDTLEEYKMDATIFLITSWYNPKEYRKSDYIEFHSHSHDLHNGGKCPGGQGGEIKCLPREDILADLKQTRELLNGTTAFCYPFYEYNSYSEELLKEAGFTMAFIGEVYRAPYGKYKLAEVGGDKMKIPRFVVVNYTTMSEFSLYFNEIK